MCSIINSVKRFTRPDPITLFTATTLNNLIKASIYIAYLISTIIYFTIGAQAIPVLDEGEVQSLWSMIVYYWVFRTEFPSHKFLYLMRRIGRALVDPFRGRNPSVSARAFLEVSVELSGEKGGEEEDDLEGSRVTDVKLRLEINKTSITVAFDGIQHAVDFSSQKVE
ncbi:hypothetical protein C8Q75DRAFT_735214 [Abortiporus biennis]|nr:hypothetical protein C8Q75DRAFT_735214 [Abortiporus biennis]